MFKCKSCGKEFPVVAWIEVVTVTWPNFSWTGTGWPPSSAITFNVNTNWQSTTVFKKPCCPYCCSLDLEEISAK